MASIKWEYTLTFIFAICSTLLVLLMVVQKQYAENYQQQLLHEIENVDSAGFTLQDIPDSPLSEHTIDEYSELIERPLFFNERRPIEISDDNGEESGAEQKVVEEVTFSLIGIINTPDSVYALFKDPKAKPDENKFKRFKQGDDIDGWTLKEINSDHVIISSGTDSQQILLTKKRVHKAVPKRRKPKKTPKTNPFQRKTKK